MKSKNTRERTEVQNPGEEKRDQTVKSPSQRFLLQVLTEEMVLIGRAITERNQQSTQIKQWCLTLWVATWGIVSIEYVMKWFEGYQYLVLCAPALFPPIFLGLDLINKRLERKFTFRGRQIYRFLNASGPGRDSGGSSLESFLETGELGDFRVYDPAAVNWYYERDQENIDSRTELEQWISIRSVFNESWGLALFYVGLFFVTIVAVAALLVIQFFAVGS